LLGELEDEGTTVVGDLEAGVGMLLRTGEGQLDVALVVVNPTVKSIEVGRRALEIASSRAREVILVANRVRGAEDLDAIGTALGDGHKVVVPEDSVIARADRDGVAAIDVDPDAPGVRAIRELADRLASR
jgi:CO dehydrogenase nickel-insertion accessory protein CooC1